MLGRQYESNHTTALQARENRQTAHTGEENAPLSPPTVVLPPEGEV